MAALWRAIAMRPGLLLSLVVVVTATGFAPAPMPRPKGFRDDLTAFQGQWAVTKYESNGRNILGMRMLRVQIDKQRWQFHTGVGAGTVTASYDIVLDPKTSPRSFDWRGAGMPASQFIGSYQLDGNKLTIVFTNAGAGMARPTSFGTIRPGDYVMVLTRDKS